MVYLDRVERIDCKAVRASLKGSQGLCPIGAEAAPRGRPPTTIS